MQVLQQAVEGAKSLDQDKLADYLRSHTFKTIAGDIKFGARRRVGRGAGDGSAVPAA